MARTVAALFDSRAEAEAARTRLLSGVRAKAPRIIARDTAGAVDGLGIDPKDKARYRSALRDGAHLLVAELPSGLKARSVIEALKVPAPSAGAPAPAQRATQPVADGEPAFHVEEPEAALAPREPSPTRTPAAPKHAFSPPVAPAEPSRAPAAMDAPVATRLEPEVTEQARVPRIEEELRVGKRSVARGGARVRSFTRERPAEEDVTLTDEIVDVESRPSQRRLSEDEVQAGGLFKERVFEIAEMREEPVVTKVAVVREEVIVRKTSRQRTETIRDTVLATGIEVEDLPPSSDQAPRFLRGSPRF
jgi:hypothetical protein